MLRTSILTFALVVAGASAAHAQRRAELLLSNAPPPEDRRCSILRRLSPEQLAAVDSAGLRRALAADSALHGTGTVLYSVRFDEAGALQWVLPIENVLSAEVGAKVEALVKSHLRPPPAREPWSLRVRVTLGAAPRVRVGRSEVCEIMQVRVRGGGGAIPPMTSGDAAQLRNGGRALVSVRVGRSGEVLEMRVDQHSGSRVVDDMAIALARDGRYMAGLVDGFPVEGWYQVGSRIETRPSRQ